MYIPLFNYKEGAFMKKYLTVKEIQKLMSTNQPMPTAMFSAKIKDYIVPARTIWYKHQRNNFERIRKLFPWI
jgi:hypothetical protein